ncbi:hypothetical protein QTP88_010716 [Uroleucon formosanum]
MTERFKNTISYQLTTRFELTWKDIVTARHVASFLDPRYIDMEHEPVKAREIIRSHVLQLIESVAPTIKNPSDTEESDLKMSNVLAFIYKDHTNSTNDASTQFTGYLSEPQLRFYLNPLEWWRTREEKYPAIATIAKKYLAIPSTSASSERCFSTAAKISSNAVAILECSPISASTECSFLTYDIVHTARRNRLTNDRASKLVYIKHNLKIKQGLKQNKIDLLNSSGEDSYDFPDAVEEEVEEDTSIILYPSDNETDELFKAVNSYN